MENDELLRRAEDLARRCEKSGDLTSTFFLTPAEQAAVRAWAVYGTDCQVIFSGGGPECERQAAFFIPYYLSIDAFKVEEHIRAVKIKAGFGQPEHRDYLGAVLGLGIRREWIGDIIVQEDTAYIFCLPTVENHLVSSLEKVGRYGVKTQSVPVCSVPLPAKQLKRVSFTVKSPRLDAVAAGMFGISRTEAARLIDAGAASVDYIQCLKGDTQLKEGAVISLRGFGKGTLTACGGTSRKGRTFVDCDILK